MAESKKGKNYTFFPTSSNLGLLRLVMGAKMFSKAKLSWCLWMDGECYAYEYYYDTVLFLLLLLLLLWLSALIQGSSCAGYCEIWLYRDDFF